MCKGGSCLCLPQWSEKDFAIEAAKRSPLDNLGYKTSCCWCIPLKAAAVLICIVTFIWAGLEIQTSEGMLKNIVDSKEILRYVNLAYTCLSILLMISAGILLTGVLLEKNILINVFIWYALFYLCLNTVLLTVSTACTAIRNSKLKSRIGFKLAISILWNCLYFYFLLIVNSYRTTIW